MGGEGARWWEKESKAGERRGVGSGRGWGVGGWTGGRTCDVVTEKGRQEDRGRWAGSVQAELGFQANQPLPLLEAPGSELRAVLVSLFLRPGGLLFRRRPDAGAGRGTFSRAWSSVWAAGPPSSHGGPRNCPSPNTPFPDVTPSRL